MTLQQYKVAKKYPFIFDYHGKISLWRVDEHINVVQSLEFDYLRKIGLQDFMKDIEYILLDIKKERKLKLEKIKKEYES